MIVITRTKTETEGSVKYECTERNDSLGKETKQPNLQKEERSDKSLRVVVVTKRGWVVNQINQTYFLKGLRMKKSVCLMAILGAFCATGANAAIGANDQTVDIRFTGYVTESTCVIGLKGNGTELELGVVKKPEGGWKKGNKGSLVPVIFEVTNCDKTGVQAIDIEADLMGDNYGNSNIGEGTLSTNKKAMNVQLYQDRAAGTKGIKKTGIQLNGTGPNNKKGEALVGYATLEHNGNSDPLKAGELIEAKAMFKLTFN